MPSRLPADESTSLMISASSLESCDSNEKTCQFLFSCSTRSVLPLIDHADCGPVPLLTVLSGLNVQIPVKIFPGIAVDRRSHFLPVKSSRVTRRFVAVAFWASRFAADTMSKKTAADAKPMDQGSVFCIKR